MLDREELIELMAATMWNLHATVPWHTVPVDWKPFYLKVAEAGLEVVENSQS